MIKRSQLSKKNRDCLFTPKNITKYEFAHCRDHAYKKIALKQKVRSLCDGPCIWIMKNGKIVDFTLENKAEDILIEKGTQLPKDRSEEPSEFWING